MRDGAHANRFQRRFPLVRRGRRNVRCISTTRWHSTAALRGNVETELAGDDEANGCGCAYPESVPDDDVERSNAILSRLRAAAPSASTLVEPGVRARLAALPMHLVAEVGDARIGIVHGDAWALAGWRFAHDSLHNAEREPSLSAVFEQAALDGFASTHTCLPALKVFDTPLGERFVVNNGAAGMPNFSNTRYGLITRLATIPVPRALVACSPVRCRRGRCVCRCAGGALRCRCVGQRVRPALAAAVASARVLQTSHRQRARLFHRRGTGPRAAARMRCRNRVGIAHAGWTERRLARGASIRESGERS